MLVHLYQECMLQLLHVLDSCSKVASSRLRLLPDFLKIVPSLVETVILHHLDYLPCKGLGSRHIHPCILCLLDELDC